ncbi:MAG: hypothetical protein QM504_10190 [Pseudomonadota bacterium]
MKSKAWKWLKDTTNHDDVNNAPDDWMDAKGWDQMVFGRWSTDIVYEVLSGGYVVFGDEVGFWDDVEAKKPKLSMVKSKDTDGKSEIGDIDISEHFHTTLNRNVFIVRSTIFLSKESFKSVVASAKARGGWYSRKWKDSPGGYCFNELTDAQAWRDTEFMQLLSSLAK